MSKSLTHALQAVYDTTIRPHLPRKIGVYNTIPVRRDRLLDTTDVHRTYEHALLTAIREHVRRGDSVTVCGGGLGVSSVAAAKQSQTGRVAAYEAANTLVSVIDDTAGLNGVGGRVIAVHAAVSHVYSPRGEMGDVETVEPSDVRECDVLVVDVDGAEFDVLSGLRDSSWLPDRVIVEHHSVSDGDQVVCEYDPDLVRCLVEGLGFGVVDEVCRVTPWHVGGEEAVVVGERGEDA